MLFLAAAILSIGFLIMVHEAGHYFVARWCKMRVDRFSIGFGPPLLSWRRGETDFTIGPILFGGFVLIHGMTMIDEVDPDDERQYPNRPVWQRFATIFAGPATNYLTAIVLGIILFAVSGVPTSRNQIVSLRDGVESVGGLKAGDVILKVGDTPLRFSHALPDSKPLLQHVQEAKTTEMSFTVLREGEQLQVKATPHWDDKMGRYLLGVDLGGVPDEPLEVGFFEATKQAFLFPVRQTQVIGRGLYNIITLKEKPQASGVVKITAVTRDAFEEGWVTAIHLLMLLNVYLGLFNLLPFPALDGGRLVFLAYEMATRRRANPKIEATVHMVGIMALLVVMVLVTYQDIVDVF